MRPKILACLILFTIAMEVVAFAAKHIVKDVGIIAGLLTIAAMYGAAVYWERRRRSFSDGIEP